MLNNLIPSLFNSLERHVLHTQHSKCILELQDVIMEHSIIKQVMKPQMTTIMLFTLQFIALVLGMQLKSNKVYVWTSFLLTEKMSTIA